MARRRRIKQVPWPSTRGPRELVNGVQQHADRTGQSFSEAHREVVRAGLRTVASGAPEHEGINHRVSGT